MKSLRYAIEGAFAYLLYGLSAILPPDWASWFAGKLGRAVGPFLKPTRLARANLQRIFPEKSATEIEQIILDMWEHFGRLVGEFPHLKWIAANRLEIVGREYIDALRDDGKPGMFVSGHYGNWELIGAGVCHCNLPLTLVYRAANNPYVENLYRRGRKDAATGGQIAKGSDGAREILKVLKGCGHLGILIDQKMNDGIMVPFLGVAAKTAPGTARFALKFDCPLSMTKVERLDGKLRFRMTIYPPQSFSSQEKDAREDILQIMTELNDAVSGWIRQHPEQWLWFHRRWPTEAEEGSSPS